MWLAPGGEPGDGCRGIVSGPRFQCWHFWLWPSSVLGLGLGLGCTFSAWLQIGTGGTFLDPAPRRDGRRIPGEPVLEALRLLPFRP